MVEDYLKQMSPKERIAYEIAKKKLGVVFQYKEKHWLYYLFEK